MGVYKAERVRTPQGKLRIESLLRAAERVFGKIGYHATTTNAIAKEADVSVATLYQFFPNKEAIAEMLALRYADKLAEALQAIRHETLTSVDIENLVSRLVDPLINFHKEYPAFRTLLTEAPASSATERKQALSTANNGAVAKLFMTRNPKLSNEQALLTAQACIAVFVGFLPLIAGTKDDARRKYIKTLKEVLVRFLEPVI